MSWRRWFPLALALLAGAASAEDAPRRVVSMNLCTDQMAMLVAAPGQLYSVSSLAVDGMFSAMAGQAAGYAVNHGQAEEIFLMEPDLVLAGTYTTRATVELLRKLGIRVEEFRPENSFDDVRANLRRLGAVLGREERAAEIVAAMDADLAALSGEGASGKTAAAYYANSSTSGAGTFMDAVIVASGLTNIADRLGFAGPARLPLELLVLAAPDVLIDSGRESEAPALAYENYVHPAYRALVEAGTRAEIPARYTVCGGPFTMEAVRLLRDAARR